jgi:hypothetical protein
MSVENWFLISFSRHEFLERTFFFLYKMTSLKHDFVYPMSHNVPMSDFHIEGGKKRLTKISQARLAKKRGHSRARLPSSIMSSMVPELHFFKMVRRRKVKTIFADSVINLTN